MCKHVLFVYLKVLKIPDPLNYQLSFTEDELAGIFEADKTSHIKSTVSPQIVEYYNAISEGREPNPVETPGLESGRKPIEGDCPICFEDLTEAKPEETVWCKATCGNSLHRECFLTWRREGKNICVFCRSPWEADEKELGGLPETGGFCNLGAMVGLPKTRDTSSYHKPWLNQRQGKNRR